MVVIDTHVMVWWVSGCSPLSTAAGQAIERALDSPGGGVIVSSISAWEVAMLVNKNRLILSMDINRWLEQVDCIAGLCFMPVNNDIGVASTMLPGDFHKDPADRIIVATARVLALPLITADEKIRAYEHVRTIW